MSAAEFTDTFKALAGEVLHDNSQRLVGDHATQIGALLTPVREQLKTFQDVVQQVYVQEARERSLLSREIAALDAASLEKGRGVSVRLTRETLLSQGLIDPDLLERQDAPKCR